MRSTEAQWEDLFVRGVRKVNEGNQGAILTIDPAYQNAFHSGCYKAQSGSEEGTIPVIKIDKIGSSGSGKAEYDKQMRAYQLVSESPVSDVVRVPRLWETDRHYVLAEQTDSLYRNTGLKHGNVEFLVMEQVDGLDLATFAYQQALLEMVRSDSTEGYVRPEHALLYSFLRHRLVREIAFGDIGEKPLRGHMMRLAGRLRSAMLNANYEFLEVWDNSVEAADRDLLLAICPIEQEIATLLAMQEGKEDALGTYLATVLDVPMLEQAIVDMRPECTIPKSAEERRLKFVSILLDSVAFRGLLHEELCDAGRQAIIALHDQGYYHCDLHERNLMVSQDRKSLYLIDFGKSNPNGDTSGAAHNYHRYDGQGADDCGILSAPGGLLYLLTRQPRENARRGWNN